MPATSRHSTSSGAPSSRRTSMPICVMSPDRIAKLARPRRLLGGGVVDDAPRGASSGGGAVGDDRGPVVANGAYGGADGAPVRADSGTYPPGASAGFGA